MKKMNMDRRLSWLVIGAFLLFAALEACFAGELELNERAEVVRGNVRLMDVISGAFDVPDDILKRDVIGAPTVGSEMTLTRQMIENALGSWVKDHPIVWQGALQCVVARPSKIVAAAELNHWIQTALETLTNKMGTVTICEYSDAKPIVTPKGDMQVQVEIPPAALRNEWTQAVLRFTDNGETVLMRTVRFRWSWEREVYQAARDLKSGDVLTSGDFVAVKRNALELDGVIFSSELNSDYVISRNLSAGSVLMENSVKPRTLVAKGTVVMVNYRGRTVTVTMKGTALEDGYKGQVIAVRNDDSRKKIYARVNEEGVLEYVH